MDKCAVANPTVKIIDFKTFHAWKVDERRAVEASDALVDNF
jgi:hypothetical protein